MLLLAPRSPPPPPEELLLFSDGLPSEGETFDLEGKTCMFIFVDFLFFALYLYLLAKEP